MAESLPEEPSNGEKPATRDVILDAAERVVMRDGAGRLTIDAVVRESGFSKGGVLYNFPSKLALIEGMIERLLLNTRADITALAEAAERRGLPPAGAIIHALVEHGEKNHELSMGLLAAAAEHPHLLDPVRVFMEEMRAQMTQMSANPDAALIALLAADGLHLGHMLKLYDFSPEERASLRDRLVSLVLET